MARRRYTGVTGKPLAGNDLQDILSVSALTELARNTLESTIGRVSIQGELSNLARPASGHLYFTLKDDTAQVRCAMFRNRARGLRCRPENGLEVLATGLVSLYAARGDFQLIVDTLEVAGEGLLALRFEQLKRKLDAEGLFDADSKRPLPEWPGAIGVISSPSGAAVQDIIKVLRRRCPAIPVIVYPTLVQGEGAAAAISNMIEIANARGECDVLILARGGGSLEDLWSFNEERVARAVFESELPIVSGVGHEVDVTIADLVADLRAPTPSAAAELVSPDIAAMARHIQSIDHRLRTYASHRIARERQGLDNLARRLVTPQRRLEMNYQRLDELSQRLAQAVNVSLRLNRGRLSGLAARAQACTPRERLAVMRRELALQQRRLHTATSERLRGRRRELDGRRSLLEALSPLATLQRGYAIVTGDEDRIVREADTLVPGAQVSARLARGSFTAAVETVINDDDQPDDHQP